ncbi:MAG TPA: hypothetical protein VF736_21145 [Pyrinomonadaceae bacterium]|jgi:hypothetical protein
MKRTVTLCCVTLTLAAAVCAQGQRRPAAPQTPAAPVALDHGGRIDTTYDGFGHETVVALRRMSVTCEMAKAAESVVKGVCVSLQAALHCPGKQLDYVRRATVRLTFEAKNWDARHPPGQRELVAVADGETVRLGQMRLAAHGVGEGWFAEDAKETLEADIPYEAFLKLARASYVELSVGKTSFALRDKNVAALRDMNNRVNLSRRAPDAPKPSGGN